MKKLILLAFTPMAMLAIPAVAQPVEQQTVIEHPDGTVTRTVTRRDNDYQEDRTVVRTEGNGDRRWEDRRGDGDHRWEGRRDGGERRWDGRRDDRRWERRREVRRCWTTWRYHRRVQTCTVRRGRY